MLCQELGEKTDKIPAQSQSGPYYGKEIKYSLYGNALSKYLELLSSHCKSKKLKA
jgi:hypothetical protein